MSLIERAALRMTPGTTISIPPSRRAIPLIILALLLIAAFAAIAIGMTSLEHRLDRLNAKLDQLDIKIGELGARLERVQQGLDALSAEARRVVVRLQQSAPATEAEPTPVLPLPQPPPQDAVPVIIRPH